MKKKGAYFSCMFCTKPVYRAKWEQKRYKYHFCNKECFKNFKKENPVWDKNNPFYHAPKAKEKREKTCLLRYGVTHLQKDKEKAKIRGLNSRKTHKKFCEEILEKNSNFSPVETYQTDSIKINFKCLNCGYIFKEKPNKFLYSTYNCQNCQSKKSKGEKKVEEFLKNNNICYTKQNSMGCKNPITNYNLRFDFYLPLKKIVIEYDGKQHFKSGSWNNTIQDLEEIQYRDDIKNKFCEEKNIKLIRIPYWEFDNIEIKLKNNLLRGEI